MVKLMSVRSFYSDRFMVLSVGYSRVRAKLKVGNEKLKREFDFLCFAMVYPINTF